MGSSPERAVRVSHLQPHDNDCNYNVPIQSLLHSHLYDVAAYYDCLTIVFSLHKYWRFIKKVALYQGDVVPSIVVFTSDGA